MLITKKNVFSHLKIYEKIKLTKDYPVPKLNLKGLPCTKIKLKVLPHTEIVLEMLTSYRNTKTMEHSTGKLNSDEGNFSYFCMKNIIFLVSHGHQDQKNLLARI